MFNKKFKFAFLLAFGMLLLDICINKAYAIDEVYNNYDPNASKVSCGSFTNIPEVFPKSVSIIITIIQIAVPIVLVILGMMDLLKSLSASKEDEMNKARNLFFKRLIAAVLLFFVFAIVKILISAVAKNDNNLISCMNCFIRGKCNQNVTDQNRWSCKLDNYTLTYDADGNLYLVGEEYRNAYISKSVNAFVPSTLGECPSSSEYYVKVESPDMNTRILYVRKK